MIKPGDEVLIEKVTGEISQDSEAAIMILCILLASPEKFKDLFEYSYCFGKLFALVMDNHFGKISPKLSYDEAGETIIDERIEREIENFSAKEKSNIAAFLLGASKPLNLSTIEAIAGKL
jgi:hypothetical protein